MERDRLQEFHEATADAVAHIQDASQEYVACRKANYGKPLTDDQQELLVGAWLSALAITRERILHNAQLMGYAIDEMSLAGVELETEQLEKWLANVREKNVGRRRDEAGSSGEASHAPN